jgi:hypothetical protein
MGKLSLQKVGLSTVQERSGIAEYTPNDKFYGQNQAFKDDSVIENIKDKSYITTGDRQKVQNLMIN